MRFFSRELISGNVDDTEARRISALYQQHVDNIISSASAEIAELAQANLHDGLIRRVVVKHTAHELLLSLRCGDLQVGYFDIDIQYIGVSLDAQQLEVLSHRAYDKRTEILADEIDMATDGRFVHRLLFWPDDELEIVFSSLHITRQEQPDRNVNRDKQPYLDIT